MPTAVGKILTHLLFFIEADMQLNKKKYYTHDMLDVFTESFRTSRMRHLVTYSKQNVTKVSFFWTSYHIKFKE